MVKADLISSGRFDEITRLSREAVSIMLGFEFQHLGINEESRDTAFESATLLSNLFYFPIKEGARSFLVGSGLEVTKSRFPGSNGHIAVSTNDIYRAIDYLKRKGVSILPETEKDRGGTLRAVHVGKEVSGFAIHLVQK